MKTIYNIKMRTASGDNYRPLTAHTDAGARRQAAISLAEKPAPARSLVCISWFRPSDQCRGELDI